VGRGEGGESDSISMILSLEIMHGGSGKKTKREEGLAGGEVFGQGEKEQ